MKQIILNEWKMLLRNKIFVYLSLFFISTLIIITALGIIQNNKQLELQQNAQAHVREQWENINDMNPHSAAHYGSYAFKPPTFLSSMDDGINSVTGNVLRLEGHTQNEMVYSEVSQSLFLSKFGKLKPSLLLQYVIPLLLIFLAFGSVSNEKEHGRIKLLSLQGMSVSQIVFGKAISIWFYGLILLLTTICFQLLSAYNTIDADSIIRICLLLLVYAGYYYVISVLATGFSAWMKSKSASLSAILAIWIVWTIFLPKIWGNTAEKLYPLPAREEFKMAMLNDRSKGLDGHNPSDIRSQNFKKEILEKYSVESIDQLPVNFDGLRMQADEEYGNTVWDKHFGNNNNILREQKKFYQLSGVFNPFASLQSIGMGLCGSDMFHHLDFLKQAENYRRVLIRSLNEKQAYGGSRTGDWSWKAGNDFYKSVKDFSYTVPVLKDVIHYYQRDILFLLIWVLATTFIVSLTVNKIKLI